MLEYAFYHTEELIKKYQNLSQSKYNYYSFCSYRNFAIDIKKDSWEKEQYVSIDNKGDIIGYLCANIDRDTRNISQLNLINFSDNSKIYSLDLLKFLRTLKRYRTITWSVAIGNPAEKKYDSICKRLNGRIVGFFKNNIRCLDGKLHDVKYYEVENAHYKKYYE